MSADARALYRNTTAWAREGATRLRGDQNFPTLLVAAHGDRVTAQRLDPIRDRQELDVTLLARIPSMLRELRAVAAALQWTTDDPQPPASSTVMHRRLNVLAIERDQALESSAEVLVRHVARMHPVLGEFPEPERTLMPATGPKAGDPFWRSLLFGLDLVT